MLYKDATAPLDDRVKDLLGRMSIEEKFAQLRCVSTNDVAPHGVLDTQAAQEQLAAGVGHLARGVYDDLPPEQIAESSNDLQRFLIEHTRLGIPALIYERDLVDTCSSHHLVMPAAIGLAASFSPALARELAVLQRAQARSIGSHMVIGPDLDLAHAQGGTAFLTGYGDNAYLVSRMGVSTVRGLQGELLRDGVAACACLLYTSPSPRDRG